MKEYFLKPIIIGGIIGFAIAIIKELVKSANKRHKRRKEKKAQKKIEKIDKEIKKTQNEYNIAVNNLDNSINKQVEQLYEMDRTMAEFAAHFYSLSDENISLYRNSISAILDFTMKMADTVNKTKDIRVFVDAYSAIDKSLLVLSKHEFTGFFIHDPPSKTRSNILSKKHYTEMDFLKRAYPNRISADLLTGVNAKYFRTFTPETLEYIRNGGIEASKPIPIPKDFDTMEGHDFEYFCADVLRKNGFSDVSVTTGSGDQGVDIIATKDSIKYAIQCKRYSSPLGNTPIQEVNAGKQFYNCHIGVVMTNQYFTSGGKELAEKTGVLLWDRDKLEAFIKNIN